MKRFFLRQTGSRSVLRALSLALICSFVFPYLSWAFELDNYSNALSVNFHGRPIELPSHLGKITQMHQGTGRLVLHVQDLHCNYQVQSNIMKMIEYFAKVHGLRWVAIEGASQPVNVTKLSTFPIQTVKEDVGDWYMRQGKISGAEAYAALCQKNAVVLEGLENPEHYLYSLELARKFMTDEVQGCVWDLRSALEEIKPRVYSAKLKKYDEQQNRYRNGDLSLQDHIRELLRSAVACGLDKAQAPNLRAYLHAGASEQPLDLDAVDRELRTLDRLVRERLYTRTAEKELDDLWQRLEVVEKLVNISAAPDDLARFRSDPWKYEAKVFLEYLAKNGITETAAEITDGALFDLALGQAKEFYAAADQRTRDFVLNLKRGFEKHRTDLTMLVTGGFHTPELLEELEAQGYSYLSIRPNVSQPDVVNPYFSLLRNRLTPLEKLVAQNQNLLATPPFFACNPDPAAILKPEELSENARLNYEMLQGTLLADAVLERGAPGMDEEVINSYPAYAADNPVESGRSKLDSKNRLVYFRKGYFAVAGPADTLPGGYIERFRLRRGDVGFYAHASYASVAESLDTSGRRAWLAPRLLLGLLPLGTAGWVMVRGAGMVVVGMGRLSSTLSDPNLARRITEMGRRGASFLEQGMTRLAFFKAKEDPSTRASNGTWAGITSAFSGFGLNLPVGWANDSGLNAGHNLLPALLVLAGVGFASWMVMRITPKGPREMDPETAQHAVSLILFRMRAGLARGGNGSNLREIMRTLREFPAAIAGPVLAEDLLSRLAQSDLEHDPLVSFFSAPGLEKTFQPMLGHLLKVLLGHLFSERGVSDRALSEKKRLLRTILNLLPTERTLADKFGLALSLYLPGEDRIARYLEPTVDRKEISELVEDPDQIPLLGIQTEMIRFTEDFIKNLDQVARDDGRRLQILKLYESKTFPKEALKKVLTRLLELDDRGYLWEELLDTALSVKRAPSVRYYLMDLLAKNPPRQMPARWPEFLNMILDLAQPGTKNYSSGISALCQVLGWPISDPELSAQLIKEGSSVLGKTVARASLAARQQDAADKKIMTHPGEVGRGKLFRILRNTQASGLREELAWGEQLALDLLRRMARPGTSDESRRAGIQVLLHLAQRAGIHDLVQAMLDRVFYLLSLNDNQQIRTFYTAQWNRLYPDLPLQGKMDPTRITPEDLAGMPLTVAVFWIITNRRAVQWLERVIGSETVPVTLRLYAILHYLPTSSDSTARLHLVQRLYQDPHFQGAVNEAFAQWVNTPAPLADLRAHPWLRNERAKIYQLLTVSRLLLSYPSPKALRALTQLVQSVRVSDFSFHHESSHVFQEQVWIGGRIFGMAEDGNVIGSSIMLHEWAHVLLGTIWNLKQTTRSDLAFAEHVCDHMTMAEIQAVHGNEKIYVNLLDFAARFVDAEEYGHRLLDPHEIRANSWTLLNGIDAETSLDHRLYTLALLDSIPLKHASWDELMSNSARRYAEREKTKNDRVQWDTLDPEIPDNLPGISVIGKLRQPGFNVPTPERIREIFETVLKPRITTAFHSLNRDLGPLKMVFGVLAARWIYQFWSGDLSAAGDDLVPWMIGMVMGNGSIEKIPKSRKLPVNERVISRQGNFITHKIGIGTIVKYNGLGIPDQVVGRPIDEKSIEQEQRRFEATLEKSNAEIEQALFSSDNPSTDLELAYTRTLMFNRYMVSQQIAERKLNAADVLRQLVLEHKRDPEVLETWLYGLKIANRLDDVSDHPVLNIPEFEPFVLVVKEPDPMYISEIMAAHSERLQAIIWDGEYRRLHWAGYVAEQFSVPVLGDLDLQGFFERCRDGDEIITDSMERQIVVNPDPKVKYKYINKKLRSSAIAEIQSKYLGKAAYSADRVSSEKMNVAVTLSSVPTEQEIRAINLAAEGNVGLYRLEYHYAHKIPTEDELVRTVLSTADRLTGTVSFRAPDRKSGDKDQDAFAGEGDYGIKFLLGGPETPGGKAYRTLCRAMVRAYSASANKNVRFFLPMIETPEEAAEARRIFDEMREQVVQEGLADRSADSMPFGAMIETKSALNNFKDILVSGKLDFVSIGTRDLGEAFGLATDLSDEYLGAIRKVLDAADAEGIPVSLCGERAADPNLLLSVLSRPGKLPQFALVYNHLASRKAIFREVERRKILAEEPPSAAQLREIVRGLVQASESRAESDLDYQNVLRRLFVQQGMHENVQWDFNRELDEYLQDVVVEDISPAPGPISEADAGRVGNNFALLNIAGRFAAHALGFAAENLNTFNIFRTRINEVRWYRTILQNDAEFSFVNILSEGERKGGVHQPFGSEIGFGDRKIQTIGLDLENAQSMIEPNKNGALVARAFIGEGKVQPLPDAYMFKIVACKDLERLDLQGMIDQAYRSENGTVDLKQAAGLLLDKLEAMHRQPRLGVLFREKHREMIDLILDRIGSMETCDSLASRVASRGKVRVQTPGGVLLLSEDDDWSPGLGLGQGAGIDIIMGIGGTPEAMMSAVLTKKLGGKFAGVLVPENGRGFSPAEMRKQARFNIDRTEIFNQEMLIQAAPKDIACVISVLRDYPLPAGKTETIIGGPKLQDDGTLLANTYWVDEGQVRTVRLRYTTKITRLLEQGKRRRGQVGYQSELALAYAHFGRYDIALRELDVCADPGNAQIESARQYILGLRTLTRSPGSPETVTAQAVQFWKESLRHAKLANWSKVIELLNRQLRNAYIWLRDEAARRGGRGLADAYVYSELAVGLDHGYETIRRHIQLRMRSLIDAYNEAMDQTWAADPSPSLEDKLTTALSILRDKVSSLDAALGHFAAQLKQKGGDLWTSFLYCTVLADENILDQVRIIQRLTSDPVSLQYTEQILSSGTVEKAAPDLAALIREEKQPQAAKTFRPDLILSRGKVLFTTMFSNPKVQAAMDELIRIAEAKIRLLPALGYPEAVEGYLLELIALEENLILAKPFTAERVARVLTDIADLRYRLYREFGRAHRDEARQALSILLDPVSLHKAYENKLTKDELAGLKGSLDSMGQNELGEGGTEIIRNQWLRRYIELGGKPTAEDSEAAPSPTLSLPLWPRVFAKVSAWFGYYEKDEDDWRELLERPTYRAGLIPLLELIFLPGFAVLFSMLGMAAWPASLAAGVLFSAMHIERGPPAGKRRSWFVQYALPFLVRALAAALINDLAVEVFPQWIAQQNLSAWPSALAEILFRSTAVTYLAAYLLHAAYNLIFPSTWRTIWLSLNGSIERVPHVGGNGRDLAPWLEQVRKAYATEFGVTVSLPDPVARILAKGLKDAKINVGQLAAKFHFDRYARSRPFIYDEQMALDIVGDFRLFDAMNTAPGRLRRLDPILLRLLQNAENAQDNQERRVVHLGIGMLPYAPAETADHLSKAFHDGEMRSPVRVIGLDKVVPWMVQNDEERGWTIALDSAGNIISVMGKTGAPVDELELSLHWHQAAPLYHARWRELMERNGKEPGLGNAGRIEVPGRWDATLDPWKAFVERHPNLELLQQDITQMNLPGPADIICAPNLELHFSKAAWQQVKEQAAGQLREGGYFVETQLGLEGGIRTFAFYVKRQGRLDLVPVEAVFSMRLLRPEETAVLSRAAMERLHGLRSDFPMILKELRTQGASEVILTGIWGGTDLRRIEGKEPMVLRVRTDGRLDQKQVREWESNYGIRIVESSPGRSFSDPELKIDINSFLVRRIPLDVFMLSEFFKRKVQRPTPRDLMFYSFPGMFGPWVRDWVGRVAPKSGRPRMLQLGRTLSQRALSWMERWGMEAPAWLQIMIFNADLDDLAGFIGSIPADAKVIGVMGSARVPEESVDYTQAKKLGEILAGEGYHILCGGGPGIMEAAPRGAKKHTAATWGVSISIPQEQMINEFIDHPIEIHSFPLRKLAFTPSDAVVAVPGGFSTFDEVLEFIFRRVPIVFYGKSYWEPILAGLKQSLSQIEGWDEAAFKADCIVTDDPKDIREFLKKKTANNARRDNTLTSEIIQRMKREFALGIRQIRRWPSSLIIVGGDKYLNAKMKAMLQKSIAWLSADHGIRAASWGAYSMLDKAETAKRMSARLKKEESEGATGEFKNDLLLSDAPTYRYLFSRKALGYIFEPGRYGKLNLLLGLLTEMQTGKMPRRPVILIGRDFWGPLMQSMIRVPLNHSPPLISEDDSNLFAIADSFDELKTAYERMKKKTYTNRAIFLERGAEPPPSNQDALRRVEERAVWEEQYARANGGHWRRGAVPELVMSQFKKYLKNRERMNWGKVLRIFCELADENQETYLIGLLEEIRSLEDRGTIVRALGGFASERLLSAVTGQLSRTEPVIEGRWIRHYERPDVKRFRDALRAAMADMQRVPELNEKATRVDHVLQDQQNRADARIVRETWKGRALFLAMVLGYAAMVMALVWWLTSQVATRTPQLVSNQIWRDSLNAAWAGILPLVPTRVSGIFERLNGFLEQTGRQRDHGNSDDLLTYFTGMGIHWNRVEWSSLSDDYSFNSVDIKGLDKNYLASAFFLGENDLDSGRLTLLSYQGRPAWMGLTYRNGRVRSVELGGHFHDNWWRRRSTLRQAGRLMDVGSNLNLVPFLKQRVVMEIDTLSREPRFRAASIGQRVDPDSPRTPSFLLSIWPGVFAPDSTSTWLSVRSALEYAEPGKEVLVLGAGPGTDTLAAHWKGAKVDAVELKKVGADNCRQNLWSNGYMDDGVRVFQGDLFSATPGKYDLIIANLPHYAGRPVSRVPVLQNFYDPYGELLTKLSEQVLEHLKPGGKAVIVNNLDPAVRQIIERKTGSPVRIERFGKQLTAAAYVLENTSTDAKASSRTPLAGAIGRYALAGAREFQPHANRVVIPLHPIKNGRVDKKRRVTVQLKLQDLEDQELRLWDEMISEWKGILAETNWSDRSRYLKGDDESFEKILHAAENLGEIMRRNIDLNKQLSGVFVFERVLTDGDLPQEPFIAALASKIGTTVNIFLNQRVLEFPTDVLKLLLFHELGHVAGLTHRKMRGEGKKKSAQRPAQGERPGAEELGLQGRVFGRELNDRLTRALQKMRASQLSDDDRLIQDFKEYLKRDPRQALAEEMSMPTGRTMPDLTKEAFESDLQESIMTEVYPTSDEVYAEVHDGDEKETSNLVTGEEREAVLSAVRSTKTRHDLETNLQPYIDYLSESDDYQHAPPDLIVAAGNPDFRCHQELVREWTKWVAPVPVILVGGRGRGTLPMFTRMLGVLQKDPKAASYRWREETLAEHVRRGMTDPQVTEAEVLYHYYIAKGIPEKHLFRELKPSPDTGSNLHQALTVADGLRLARKARVALVTAPPLLRRFKSTTQGIWNTDKSGDWQIGALRTYRFDVSGLNDEDLAYWAGYLAGYPGVLREQYAGLNETSEVRGLIHRFNSLIPADRQSSKEEQWLKEMAGIQRALYDLVLENQLRFDSATNLWTSNKSEAAGTVSTLDSKRAQAYPAAAGPGGGDVWQTHAGTAGNSTRGSRWEEQKNITIIDKASEGIMLYPVELIHSKELGSLLDDFDRKNYYFDEETAGGFGYWRSRHFPQLVLGSWENIERKSNGNDQMMKRHVVTRYKKPGGGTVSFYGYDNHALAVPYAMEAVARGEMSETENIHLFIDDHQDFQKLLQSLKSLPVFSDLQGWWELFEEGNFWYGNFNTLLGSIPRFLNKHIWIYDGQARKTFLSARRGTGINDLWPALDGKVPVVSSDLDSYFKWPDRPKNIPAFFNVDTDVIADLLGYGDTNGKPRGTSEHGLNLITELLNGTAKDGVAPSTFHANTTVEQNRNYGDVEIVRYLLRIAPPLLLDEKTRQRPEFKETLLDSMRQHAPGIFRAAMLRDGRTYSPDPDYAPTQKSERGARRPPGDHPRVLLTRPSTKILLSEPVGGLAAAILKLFRAWNLEHWGIALVEDLGIGVGAKHRRTYSRTGNQAELLTPWQAFRQGRLFSIGLTVMVLSVASFSYYALLAVALAMWWQVEFVNSHGEQTPEQRLSRLKSTFLRLNLPPIGAALALAHLFMPFLYAPSALFIAISAGWVLSLYSHANQDQYDALFGLKNGQDKNKPPKFDGPGAGGRPARTNAAENMLGNETIANGIEHAKLMARRYFRPNPTESLKFIPDIRAGKMTGVESAIFGKYAGRGTQKPVLELDRELVGALRPADIIGEGLVQKPNRFLQMFRWPRAVWMVVLASVFKILGDMRRIAAGRTGHVEQMRSRTAEQLVRQILYYRQAEYYRQTWTQQAWDRAAIPAVRTLGSLLPNRINQYWIRLLIRFGWDPERYLDHVQRELVLAEPEASKALTELWESDSALRKEMADFLRGDLNERRVAGRLAAWLSRWQKRDGSVSLSRYSRKLYRRLFLPIAPADPHRRPSSPPRFRRTAASAA